MNIIFKILLWGFLAGIIHFVILTILYVNPLVDKIYKKAQNDSKAVKKWEKMPKYIIFQFLGTQVEVLLLTAGYLILRHFLGYESLIMALITALIFTGIRVFPRFWNMFIQTTYPKKLLIIEAINGTIGTIIVIFALYFLPIK